MNKNLLLIHGAWCSKHSFNYIIQKVLDNGKVGRIHCVEYDCQTTKIDDIWSNALDQLVKIARNGLQTVVVGHSLGGLIALELSQLRMVDHTITLGSPLAGIQVGWYLHPYLYYYAPIMRELAPNSTYINLLHSKHYSKPITVICSTAGFNPMIHQPNDGVVTIESQTKWIPSSAVLQTVNVNHNEILQAPKTIMTIQRALASNI